MASAIPMRSDLTEISSEPESASGLAVVRLTVGAMFVWVFFENFGKGLYRPAGYRSTDQLLHRTQSLARCVEVSHGFGGEPRRDGCSYARVDRDLSRHSACSRPVHAPSRACSFSVSRQPLDFRDWNVVDMGIAGSGACVPWTRHWPCWPKMGHRRAIGEATTIFTVVVIGSSPSASVRHYSYT